MHGYALVPYLAGIPAIRPALVCLDLLPRLANHYPQENFATCKLFAYAQS